MKTKHQNEDIDNYFLRIKTESVFKVLKQEKYTGVKRNDIENLLRENTLNFVLNYFRSQYSRYNGSLTFIGISLTIILSFLIMYVYYNFYAMKWWLINLF